MGASVEARLKKGYTVSRSGLLFRGLKKETAAAAGMKQIKEADKRSRRKKQFGYDDPGIRSPFEILLLAKWYMVHRLQRFC